MRDKSHRLEGHSDPAVRKTRELRSDPPVRSEGTLPLTGGRATRSREANVPSDSGVPRVRGGGYGAGGVYGGPRSASPQHPPRGDSLPQTLTSVRSRLRGGTGTGRDADDPGRHIWGRGLDPTEDERTFGKYGTTTRPSRREGSGTDQWECAAEGAAESERSRDWDSGSCSHAARASDRPPGTSIKESQI